MAARAEAGDAEAEAPQSGPQDRPSPAERDDPRLFRFLWGMTGDAAAAEDLAQEARLKAWQHAESLRDPARAVAWLYGIATNLARQHLRRQRRWHWLSWEHPAAASLSQPEAEPSDRLRSTLARLSPDDRAVLLLLGHQGWSAAEVAQATGLARDAVYKRWQRACSRFRQLWEEQEA